MMISIAEAISDLLFVRDTVVVPGLGAFVKTPVSAKVNSVANYFAMPTSEIRFDANLREDNDLVVSYMSEKNDIPEEEARRLLMMFVSDSFTSLKDGKKVVLANIGKLFYDWAGDLAFEPDTATNYNADAFGLCDFSPEPVLRSKTKEEIKAEIEQQQKEKNTPVTVDEDAVHQKDTEEIEPDDDNKRRHGWLWILLGLLFVAATLLGLHYFKVIDLGLGDWDKKPQRVYPEKPVNWAEKVPSYSVDLDALTGFVPTEEVEAESVEEDTVEQSVVKPTPEVHPEVEPTAEPVTEPVVEPTVVVPEANIRIIAGCFGQEENAVRLVETLKNKGYKDAFYEQRGSKWYVSFGRYATDEEANAALREIRANTEYKAWILKP